MTEISDGNSSAEQQWHLNRGVPVVFLLSSLVYCLAQIGVFAWYASQFSTRVEIVEKVQAQMAPQGERLTRLEEKVVAVQAGVNRIEALLTAKR